MIHDGSEKSSNEEIETPKKSVRGKGREYSEAFNIAWKAYPRGEQKFEAFAVWLIRAKDVGGEPKLLTLILAALKWQVPLFRNGEEAKFLPYFERYLKRRKWEDEPPHIQAVPRRVDDSGSRATDRKVDEYKKIQQRTLTPAELADVAALAAAHKKVVAR